MIFLFRLPFPKLAFIFLSLLSAATDAAAQCNLKREQLANAPELRGFRLGMSFDEVKTRVPQIQFGRPDKSGVTKTSISPTYDPRFDQASFADVRTISLDFLDGNLTSLWIGYEGSFKWKSVEEFANGISRSLKLPAAWSPKRGGQQLRCDGFTMFVSMIAGGPSIRLTDDAAEATIAVRREEETATAESSVIGDRVSMLYYPAHCDLLESVAKPNRIVFKDREEAEKAGYKLAKDCE